MNRVIFEGGGDYPANEFIIGSGKNALLCRYQAEKQILEKQDQLTIEWAGTYRHYHSAMFRTIPIFFPLRFNSFKITLRSSVGFDPSLSTHILISSMLDVF